MRVEMRPGSPPEPDAMVEAPTDWLVEQSVGAEALALAANPIERSQERIEKWVHGGGEALPRRKHRRLERFEYAAADLYAGYTNMLVRTALVRSADWRPGETGPRVGSFDDAVQLLRHLQHLDHERVVQLMLNGLNQLVAIHEAAVGGRHGAAVVGDEMIRVGLLVSASAVVVAHNHPSGDPSPSPEDVQMTRAFVEGYKCVGIAVLDHIIVASSGRSSSMADLGIIR